MAEQVNWSEALYDALRAQKAIPPLVSVDPALTIDDAYGISLGILERRLADGEKVVGKKIGVTSKAVQDMLNVRQPDFGFLTDVMHMHDGVVDIAKEKLISPRAEAEVAFLLRKSLNGPGITEEDVLDATESVAPCFEIVDSRIRDWKISIVDTVADNASCGVFALGAARVDPRTLDLPNLKVKVRKNGAPLSEGLGSAVQGSPLTAVAWLANTLGNYGVTLDAGDVILSGSLVPLEPVVAGDFLEMDLSSVGALSLQFR